MKNNPFSSKPMQSKAVGLSLTQEQYDLVSSLAKDLGTTRNGVYKLAMADFVDKQNRKQERRNEEEQR